MKVEFVLNGGVTLLLIPENPMEEEVIKQLMKQDNELSEIRGGATVLNRTVSSGLVITKKSSPKNEQPVPPEEGKDGS
jgi:hypothetical protein